jgi:gas vesicle protein
MKNYDDHKSSHFLLGIGVGAILGILMAPRSGKETRKKLRKEAEEYLDRGQQLFEDTKERVEDIKADLEPKVHDFLEKIVPIIEETKDVSEPYRKELLEQIKDLVNDIDRKGATGLKKAKKVFRNIKKA